METNEQKTHVLDDRIRGFMNAVKETYKVSLFPSVGRSFVKMSTGNRVYCFIDIRTGNVLKAESFSKPALHARSNVYDGDFGLSGVNEYGANYLR